MATKCLPICISIFLLSFTSLIHGDQTNNGAMISQSKGEYIEANRAVTKSSPVVQVIKGKDILYMKEGEIFATEAEARAGKKGAATIQWEKRKAAEQARIKGQKEAKASAAAAKQRAYSKATNRIARETLSGRSSRCSEACLRVSAFCSGGSCNDELANCLSSCK